MKLPRRTPLKSSALLAAGALVVLSAGPGAAAQSIANAQATGLVLTVASTPTDSGAYTVMNDGTGETSTGRRNPLITALGNQNVVAAGTLAQDATTAVRDGRGFSAACAGLAGDGASLAAAGDGSCLTPGDQVSIGAGDLDFADAQLVSSDLFMGFDQATQAALQPLLDPLLQALQDGFQQGLDAFGGGLFLDAGAIQSTCTSAPSGLSADSTLADVGLRAMLGGQRVDLVDLPANPPPNTKVLTDLGDVVDVIKQALRTQFANALDSVADPLGLLTDTVLDQLNDNLVAAVAPQLAPLEDDVLTIVLNKQTRPAPGVIEVTALDLSVLPAARDFGVDLVSAQIGTSRCGPSGRVEPTPTPTPTPTTTAPPATPAGPVVPTSVPAGESQAAARTDDGALNGLLAAGALAAMGGAGVVGGVSAYRRRLRG